MCIYVCVYVCVERERERERGRLWLVMNCYTMSEVEMQGGKEKDEKDETGWDKKICYDFTCLLV